jgi:nitrite reductase/ring-hydroxylating ferredoxin subunit
MSVSPLWHPVTPAHMLRGGHNVVAALLNDQPLALWRSGAGAVQAWEDRCPHRGVPLSLGRISGEHLACAYHGWQYAAQDGRCISIPAMPNQPVPGKVCVKTYAALERQGLVWVNQAASATSDTPPPAHDPAAGVHLRSLSVDLPIASIDAALTRAGFVHLAPHIWHGALDGVATRVYTLDATPQWCLLHLLCDHAPPANLWSQRFAAIRALRDSLEKQAA